MNPGRFRDLIVVQTKTTTIGDNYEQTPVYTDGSQFWGEVKLRGGLEIADDMILQGQTQFHVRCEWNPIAAAIRTDQRLKLKTRNNLILNVTSTAEDFNGGRRIIEFVCERLEHQ